MNQPGQPPETIMEITPLRRVAAVIAGILPLPPGAGLIVLGRPGRAALWLAAAMLAYAAIVVAPIPAMGVGLLVGVGAILDSLFVSAPRDGLPTTGRFLLMLVGFVVFGTLARDKERQLLATAFAAPTAAMAPALLEAEPFMADLRGAAPRPGQIWVLDSEALAARPRDFVQRVVALPGQTVALRAGVLEIDGRSVVSSETPCLSEVPGGTCVARFEEHGGVRVTAEYRRGLDCVPPFPGEACPTGMEKRGEACVVPADHVFVLGDNRCEADDSRRYGPVPLAALRGRGLAVYWSSKDGRPRWDRIGTRLGE
ncbi:MAG: signal peptidase I [Myxococcota bacterium]|nr:signal peptidase I [Myxococcota bacterium]